MPPMPKTDPTTVKVSRLEHLQPGESGWVAYGVGARSDGTIVLLPSLPLMPSPRGFLVTAALDADGNRVYDVTMTRAQARQLRRIDGEGTVPVRDVYIWKFLGEFTGKRDLYRGTERGGLN